LRKELLFVCKITSVVFVESCRQGLSLGRAQGGAWVAIAGE